MTTANPFKEMAEAERITHERHMDLQLSCLSRINQEADTQRAVYAIEDRAVIVERARKLCEAQAQVAAQDGKNAETRAAMAQEHLSEDPHYQLALMDADAINAELREARIALTVAGWMRRLAFDAIRLEAARLSMEP